MLVFNNQQRSGYEEIASYSPRYYRSIKEMDAVFRLAGWLLDIMARDMEDMVASQFLRFMDGEALDRYERFLGIERGRSDTLEERKALIRAMLLGSGKMSRDMISAIVNQYGECDCKVRLDGSELNIIMSFKDNNDKYVGEIRRLIRIKGPAHLNFRFTVIFHMTADIEEAVMGTVMLKTVRFAVKMPFLPSRSYGTSCYNGKTRYDAKRRYRLGAGLRMRYQVGTAEEGIRNLSVETRRNVQCYDGKRHYDGTTEYNAMIRKDVVE